MRKSKFDKRITRTVIATLDKLARKYGLEEARHGANRWSQAQQAKHRLLRQRRQLRQELAQLNRKLRA